MNPPPFKPASGPSPYIAISGTEPHEPVAPRRHSRAGAAADLKRHHHPVAHPDTADAVANRDDLG